MKRLYRNQHFKYATESRCQEHELLTKFMFQKIVGVAYSAAEFFYVKVTPKRAADPLTKLHVNEQRDLKFVLVKFH